MDENVVIGQDCTVGVDTYISNSVIGQNCTIGIKMFEFQGFQYPVQV